MILEEPKLHALKMIKKNFPSGSTILDVGFGRGEFFFTLLEAGYKVIGTETSVQMVAQATARLKELEESNSYVLLTDDPNKILEPIDCLVCFEVIEHQSDPVAFLKTLPAVPSYFSTPNQARWWVQLSNGRYEAWDYPPSHLHRFDSLDLWTVLKDAEYSEVVVYEMPVVYHELLQPIYTYLGFKLGIKHNTGNYENIRNNVTILGQLVTGIRKVSWPITAPTAWLMNKKGLKGTNLLAIGVKK